MSDWHEAWIGALDALEADVAVAEELLETSHRLADLPVTDAWSPPAGLGPLPLDLRPRADAILGRQVAAAKTMVLTMVANRRQAEMAARIEAGGAPSRPAYLDCAI